MAEIDFTEEPAIDFLSDEDALQAGAKTTERALGEVTRSLTAGALAAPEPRPRAPIVPPTLAGVTPLPVAPPELAQQIISAPFRAAGSALAAGVRTARDVLSPTTYLPEEEQARLRPFVIDTRGGEIRPMTRTETAEREPIQGGRPLFTAPRTQLQPEGNDITRIMEQWSSPEGIFMLAAGNASRLIGYSILASMVPGLVQDAQAIASSATTPEEKRDKINNLFLLSGMVAGHGAGLGRPESELTKGELAVPPPLPMTGAEMVGRPRGFVPTVPTAGPERLGPPLPPARVRTMAEAQANVPGGGAVVTAPEEGRGLNQLEEIRQKGLQTKEQVLENFPQLRQMPNPRERAAELLRQAYPRPMQGPPIPPGGVPRPVPVRTVPPMGPVPEVAGTRPVVEPMRVRQEPIFQGPEIPPEVQAQREREANMQREVEARRSALQQNIVFWERELEMARNRGDRRAQEEAAGQLMLFRREYEAIPPVKQIAPKPPIARAPGTAFRPEVPGTPAEPRESVLAEIRRRKLRTKEAVLDAFPGMREQPQAREKAAELIRQAWERQGPPLPPEEPPAAPPGAPVPVTPPAPPAAPAAAAPTAPPEGPQRISRSPVPIFLSGINRNLSDIAGAMEKGVPIGVTVTEPSTGRTLSPEVRKRVGEYLARGGQVFFDSGAYDALQKGKPVDWERVMFAYRELINNLPQGPGVTRGLYITAPDVIGDPVASRALQKQYMADLQSFFSRGVNIVFPVQKEGLRPLAEAVRDVPRNTNPAFGGDVIWGIPFNKKAWTFDDIQQLFDANRGRSLSLHLLGGGDADVARVMNMAKEAGVTLEHISGDRSITPEIRARKFGPSTPPAKPEPLGGAITPEQTQQFRNAIAEHQRFIDLHKARLSNPNLPKDIADAIRRDIERSQEDIKDLQSMIDEGRGIYTTGESMASQGPGPRVPGQEPGKGIPQGLVKLMGENFRAAKAGKPEPHPGLDADIGAWQEAEFQYTKAVATRDLGADPEPWLAKMRAIEEKYGTRSGVTTRAGKEEGRTEPVTLPTGAPATIEETVIAGKTLAEWEAAKTAADLPRGTARAELARWLAVPNQPGRILQALGNKKRTREIHAPPAAEVTPVAPATPEAAPAPEAAPEAAPTGFKQQLTALYNEFQGGEGTMTERDLMGKVNDLISETDETVPPALQKAVEDYEDAILEDFKMKGRGDVEPAQEKFMSELGKFVDEGTTLSQRLEAPKTPPGQWPKPNRHGVYREDEAEKLETKFKGKRPPHADVRVLQVSPTEWIASSRYDTTAGSMSGSSSGLSKNEVFSSREQALATNLARLIATARDHTAENATQKQQFEDIAKWAQEQVDREFPRQNDRNQIEALVLDTIAERLAFQVRLDREEISNLKKGGGWEWLNPAEREKFRKQSLDNLNKRVTQFTDRIAELKSKATELRKPGEEPPAAAPTAPAPEPPAPPAPGATEPKVERVGGEPTHPMDPLLFDLGKTTGMVEMAGEAGTWRTPTITKAEFQKLTIAADKIGWTPVNQIDVPRKGVKVDFQKKASEQESIIRALERRKGMFQSIASGESDFGMMKGGKPMTPEDARAEIADIDRQIAELKGEAPAAAAPVTPEGPAAESDFDRITREQEALEARRAAAMGKGQTYSVFEKAGLSKRQLETISGLTLGEGKELAKFANAGTLTRENFDARLKEAKAIAARGAKGAAIDITAEVTTPVDTAAGKVQRAITDVANAEQKQAPAKDVKRELTKRLEDEIARLPEPETDVEFSDPKTYSGIRKVNVRPTEGPYQHSLELVESAKNNWKVRIKGSVSDLRGKSIEYYQTLTSGLPLEEAKAYAEEQMQLGNPWHVGKPVVEGTPYGKEGDVPVKRWRTLGEKFRDEPGEITISIPKDGDFTIPKTRYALERMLKQVKALDTSPGRPEEPKETLPTRPEGREFAKEAAQLAKGKPSMGPGAAAAAEFDPPPPSANVVGLDAGNRFVNEKVREWENMVAGFRQLGLFREGGRAAEKRDIQRAVDSMINIPRVWSQQAGNSFRLRLRNVAEQNAVTALMQALKMSGEGLKMEDAERLGSLEHAGDPMGYLRANQTDLETYAQQMLNEGKKLEAGGAIDLAKAMAYAREHYAELKPIAIEAKKRLDAQFARDAAAGIPVDYERWYVPQRHAIDLLPAADRPIVLGGGRGGGIGSPFRKAKVYEDYSSAIQAGFTPRSLSIADLLEHRVLESERVIARKAMFEGLKEVNDPGDGNPIAMAIPRRKITRPDGSFDIQESVPLNYEAFEIMPGVRLAIHRGYSRMLRALTGTSQISESAVVGAAQSVAAIEKHIGLALDTFHLSRVLQTELALTGKVSLGPRLHRGVALVEYTSGDLNRAVQEGFITQEMADWARKPVPYEVNGRTVNLSPKGLVAIGLKNGLNIGRIADVIYRDWIRDIPLLGKVNKLVFDKISRSAMIHGFMAEFARVAKNHPEWDANKVAATVASDINVLFGNLQKESWVQSPSLNAIARIVMLAPQWVESLIRREGRAAVQLGQAGFRLAQGKAPDLGTAGKTMGTGLLAYFMGTQVLNLITRGHLTFQNEEPEHKLDAYVPDPFSTGKGFFISPMAVFGEITHDILRYAQTKPDIATALSQIGANKLGNLGRAIGVAMLGRDPLSGEKIIGTGRRAMAAAAQAIPVPIIASGAARMVAAPFVPGVQRPTGSDIERQAASSFGFKIEPAPSAQGEVRRLVDQWKSTQEPKLQADVERRMKEEFRSSYSDLRSALGRGDIMQAKRAYQQLRQEGSTPQQIRKTIEHPHPFAGSKVLENRFYDSLTPQQQKLYEEALKEREDISDRLEKMLDTTPQLEE